jgi:ABC-2 type transport system ATP-binding protein
MRFGRLASGIVLAVLLAFAPAASARDAKVTSFDGTKISTHFFPAAGLQAGAKTPTVLVGHGYGDRGDNDPDSASEEVFGGIGLGPLRRAGFNVLTWDARGFGESGGNVEVDSPDYEGRDVQALITYVSQQPEAQLDKPGDPRMGMTGVSYGAGIQFVTAALDRRVDAISPIIGWNSLLTALYKDQTVKEGWGLALSGAGGSAYAAGLPGGETGSQDPQIQQALLEGIGTGKFSDSTVRFFDSRGPKQFLTKIKVPTFIAEGTADTLFTLHEATENYAVLNSRVPTRMMWFCGGHGVCLGNNGPDGRIEAAVVAWLRHYVKRERSVKLPPEFQWLTDDDGNWHSSPVFPVPAKAPLRGSGSGTLSLQPGASSQGAFIAASAAADAVNVDIAPPAKVMDILGEPRVKITYSGTAAPADTRLYAQVLDRRTGRVVGNQVAPIPVTLDGAEHTVERPLEGIATRGGPDARFTVQVAAGTSVYDRQRATGAVTLKQVEATLPTVDVNAVPRLRIRHLYGLAKAKRSRAARVRVRGLNGRLTKVEVRLYKRKGRRWVRVGRSKRFNVANKVRRPKIRVRHKLGRGRYLAKAVGTDRYRRKLVVRTQSRLRR